MVRHAAEPGADPVRVFDEGRQGHELVFAALARGLEVGAERGGEPDVRLVAGDLVEGDARAEAAREEDGRDDALEPLRDDPVCDRVDAAQGLPRQARRRVRVAAQDAERGRHLVQGAALLRGQPREGGLERRRDGVDLVDEHALARDPHRHRPAAQQFVRQHEAVAGLEAI